MNSNHSYSFETRPKHLKKALEKEQRNWVRRAWAALLFIMAVGYVLGAGILPIFISNTIQPLPFTETVWFRGWAITLPAAILITFSFILKLKARKNPIMPLHPHDMSYIKGGPGVWENLSKFGRILLILFGSTGILSLIVIVLLITYKM